MFDQRDCLIMQSKKAWNGTGVAARQIDRQIEGQKDRYIDRQIDIEKIYSQVYSCLNQNQKQGRQIDIQIDRQIDVQIDVQIDRHSQIDICQIDKYVKKQIDGLRSRFRYIEDRCLNIQIRRYIFIKISYHPIKKRCQRQLNKCTLFSEENVIQNVTLCNTISKMCNVTLQTLKSLQWNSLQFQQK